MYYSVQTENSIFVKDYGFLSFVKNTGKNIGKTISKNLNGNKHFLIMLNNLQKKYSKLLPKE